MFGRKKNEPIEFLKLDPVVNFIESAGGSMVSNNILTGKGKLTWALREESINPIDNGWRFLSDIDDQDYVDDAANHSIADFNTVANIEPAVLQIYGRPPGTDLTLTREGRLAWMDNVSGQELSL